MKRTALVINEQCYRQIKRLALESGRTISDIVNEFIRLGLSRNRKAKREQPGFSFRAAGIRRNTMRRSENYNEKISRKLQSSVYAQEYLNALMEGDDGLSPEDALRDMIEVMGITEFAKLVKVSKSRVIEFTKEKRMFKPATMNTFLKPFRLRAKIIFEKMA